jgi:carbonic anhydrase
MIRLCVWKAFVCSFTLCIASASLLFAQETTPEWSYAGKEGPKDWGNLSAAYRTCKIGHAQSPIDIQHAKKADLPPLKFDYKAVPLKIIDNGHTIEVIYPPGSTLTVGNKVYTLKQFHFHHPSEEHVNGHGHEMSAHLVHADPEGHLAVVGVFLDKGAANALIDSIWKSVPKQKDEELEVPGVMVNAKDLLPADLGYYSFSGSLTTPPCSEGVTWYVLKHPEAISSAEIATFAKEYPRDARPIQRAYGRELLESK